MSQNVLCVPENDIRERIMGCFEHSDPNHQKFISLHDVAGNWWVAD